MLDNVFRHCTDSYLFFGKIVVADFAISREIPRTTTRMFLTQDHNEDVSTMAPYSY